MPGAAEANEFPSLPSWSLGTREYGRLMQELGPAEEVSAFFDLTLLREPGADEEDPEPILPPVPPP